MQKYSAEHGIIEARLDCIYQVVGCWRRYNMVQGFLSSLHVVAFSMGLSRVFGAVHAASFSSDVRTLRMVIFSRLLLL